MSAFFPNGTIFSVGTVYSAAVPVTILTNANPAVATATAHAFVNGDILVVTSGWTGLNDRVVRVAGTTANTFNMEGISTLDTSRYPVGAGIGSVKEATTFSALSQITNVGSSGGEQQFYQWVYLEDGVQRQRPTFKNAKSLQLTLDYDPALAWYQALIAADEDGDPVVLRAALASGSYIYYNMYVGFDGEPSMNINQNMQVVATFSHAARFNRYET